MSTFWPFLSLFPRSLIFTFFVPFSLSFWVLMTKGAPPTGPAPMVLFSQTSQLCPSCSLDLKQPPPLEGNASLPFLICFPVRSLSSQNLLSEQASIAAMSTTISKYQESLFSDPDRSFLRERTWHVEPHPSSVTYGMRPPLCASVFLS